MELIEVIQKVVMDTVQAQGPLATGYATVVSVSPLILTIQETKLDVTEPAAVLTDNVKYRAVTVKGETVIINPGLKPGDSVLLLKSNAEQNYIVISKV